MRYIEAEGVKLAHIDINTDAEKAALCGMNPFPWDWYQPAKRTKAVCRSCLSRLRGRSG